MLKDSLQFFEQTAVDVKNEYQDLAWVYVVRVPYEAGDWAGVATAADKALAYWASPEAKKRAEADEKIAANRKAQVAAVAYWKAAALVGAKNDGGALAILDGYKAQYGRDATFYLGWAMGLRVEILLRQQKIEDAESAIDELIVDFPDYHKLPGILAQQAEYYRGKETEIQKKIDEVVAEDLGVENDRAKGAKQRLKAAIAEETNIINVISDQLQVVERARRVIELSDKPTRRKGRREDRRSRARRRSCASREGPPRDRAQRDQDADRVARRAWPRRRPRS